MSSASLLDSADRELAARVLLAFGVLFCRIGACLMLAPGASMTQIPIQVRLFIAVAITLSLTPALLGAVDFGGLDGGAPALARVLLTEILVGGLIGLLARFFLLALEALFAGVATMLGFANPFGVQLEANEVLPPLATFVTLTATALIFITDMHWEILRGLVASYSVIPVGRGVKIDFALRHVTETLCEAFWLSLRSPHPSSSMREASIWPSASFRASPQGYPYSTSRRPSCLWEECICSTSPLLRVWPHSTPESRRG